ncbi:MAG: hypothetical protein R3190_18260, partial [Thermoanaerobaculia bacterium]|nr:hypothetical protein [Thermoanaerobaculia bacterium]
MPISRHIRPALVWVLVATVGATGASPLPAALALRDVVVLQPATGETAGPTTVLIESDRIVAVGPSAAAVRTEDARTVDAAGLYLLPGLWDLHTHLTTLGIDGALPLLVTQGVTGVRELGSVPEAIEELRARVGGGELLGPRIVHAGPTLNGAANGPHHRVIESPASARRAATELQAAGVDLLKTHNATERETYFALLAAAREVGLTVAGHIPKTVSPIEACEAGHASVEHVATIFEGTYTSAHGNELAAFSALPAWIENEADALVECFARHGTLFVPTLRTYELRAHRAAAYDDPDPRLRYLGGPEASWGDWSPSGADRMEKVI